MVFITRFVRLFRFMAGESNEIFFWARPIAKPEARHRQSRP
jgi:hypothetical protein